MNLDTGRKLTRQSINNVTSRKVADLVASRLRTMIAKGELVEGDWLPTEAELTELFDVSRPTLREAFRLLEGDGLVRIRRGPPGGARVQIPGPEQAARLFGLILTLSGTTLRDVYEARMLIETASVRRLAEVADSDVVASLREAIETARASIDDDTAFAVATTTFHLALVSAAGNHTLFAVIGTLSEITTRHVALSYRESRQRNADELLELNERAMRGYEKVVNLIEKGDADRAEAYWHEHMQVALEYLESENDATRAVIDVLE